jgi:XTP/dITP diphosphohydrolase
LVKAIRIQEKSKQVGFEWENANQVWEKVSEEIGELKLAVESKNISDIEDEMGDVLFSMVNYARFLNVDAENALERTNKKFMHRFSQMEAYAAKEKKLLHDMDLESLDKLWNLAKNDKI